MFVFNIWLFVVYYRSSFLGFYTHVLNLFLNSSLFTETCVINKRFDVVDIFNCLIVDGINILNGLFCLIKVDLFLISFFKLILYILNLFFQTQYQISIFNRKLLHLINFFFHFIIITHWYSFLYFFDIYLFLFNTTTTILAAE